MSNQEPENNNLIKSIAGTVETLSDQMTEMRGQMTEMRGQMTEVRVQMVTKDDLEKMATKSDVESLGKDVESLGKEVKTLGKEVETLGKEVETLSSEVSFIAGQVETMRDQMATKTDLAQLEDRLTTKLEVQITAVRGDIEQVNLRLDPIERSIRARLDQIETEMSRLRSVLYLLVKDRPDMLRLLGQTPPMSGEGHP
ncbi:MAG TPA: hypothetical protein VKB86_12445 [Pyrinomonadaceae bacterium]|nr:hypothetical protein [Pyrinomonadaceae bacterium]